MSIDVSGLNLGVSVGVKEGDVGGVDGSVGVGRDLVSWGSGVELGLEVGGGGAVGGGAGQALQVCGVQRWAGTSAWLQVGM